MEAVNIGQTPVIGLLQNQLMSAEWYHHKAEQCARLAKETTEPRKRTDLETERKLWLEIAADLEKDERANLPKPSNEGRQLTRPILRRE